MRILQVMAGRNNGGAELYSTDVMLSLAAAGIDQCVAVRDSAPPFERLQRAGLRMAPEVYHGGVRLWQSLNMRRLIKREQPDIIHCWMRRAASLVPASANRRAAVVGWFGDYEKLQHFSHCSHLVGCTPDLKRYMQEHGSPEARSAYIPTFPSVDAQPAFDRARLDTPADAKLLLTLSRLHPTKGLDTLIQAMAALPDCYLWIAGDGPMRHALENLARETGVAARIRFLGWRTDRGALLRAADICLLPSSYEPFGTVILDAWSTKTAFIACDSAGPRSHTRNAENGMLVPANDPAALGRAIGAVISDPALKQRIVAGGYAEYQARFTREIVTRQWIDYYTSLLASRPR
jgi:glycosyltransferase involved in cell wall biosynthesis